MSVWLLSGDSRGLGRPLAETLLAAGHQLIATGPIWLEDLIERYGTEVQVMPPDLADEPGVVAAVQRAVDAFGRLDVLVNLTSDFPTGSIEDTSLADFRAQIDSTLLGAINLTKAVLPLMREQRSGHIIQVSKVEGRLAAPGWAASAAAKCGMDAFSEVLAREVAPLGIRVTILEPGELRLDSTPSLAPLEAGRPEYDDTVGAAARFERSCSGKEPGDPLKAAKVILHIASLVDPPARLVLGRTAIRSVARATLARIENDQRWRHLSLSTDFVEQTEPQMQLGQPAGVEEPTLPQALATRLRPRTSAATAPSAAKAEQTSSAV